MSKSKKQKNTQVLTSHYSAGGAVYRQKNEWLLINPKDTNRWQLPKGTIDPGEKSEVTAVREVFEETGVKGEIVEKIETIRYFFMADRHKIFKSVVFYLMKSAGEEPKIERKWAHEINEAKWFPFTTAIQNLTYKSDQEILKKAEEKTRRVG